MTTLQRRVPYASERATLNLWPEVGNILGLSKASVYEAAHRDEIPTIRVGRRLLVPTAALRRMLQLDVDSPDTLREPIVTAGGGQLA